MSVKGKSEMRYFLQNGSYEFVEVSATEYNNPPTNMIDNKILYDRGFVTMNIANVDMADLSSFFSKVGQILEVN
jgi:hypothetical protein